MKKKIYLLGMLLIIGCSNPLLKPPVSNINTRDKGVLAVSFAKVKTIVGPFKVEKNHNITYIVICNSLTNNCVNVSMKEKYGIFSLQEGKYYIGRIRIDGFGISERGTFNKNINRATIASFEVKKNEVIYLGDIPNMLIIEEFRQKQKFYFCVKNNLPEAQSYIKQNFPFLNAENMQFQPLELGTQSEYKCEENKQ
jgi:hypothetical protein